jgi:hypothetical protein
MTAEQLHLKKTYDSAIARDDLELAVACLELLGKSIGMWPDEPSEGPREILRSRGIEVL